MNDNTLSLIADNPIGDQLDEFLDSFASAQRESGLSTTLDNGDDEVVQSVLLELFRALQNLRLSMRLPSARGSKSLFVDILSTFSAGVTGSFNVVHSRPLLASILSRKPDVEIWQKVYDAVSEHTPERSIVVATVQDTPSRFSSSVIHSSENRSDLDDLLRSELGLLYVGIPDFYEAFFGSIANLNEVSGAFLAACQDGPDALFHPELGWTDWPRQAQEKDVVAWLSRFNDRVEAFIERFVPAQTRPQTHRLRLWACPEKPIEGSVALRKMDVGFFNRSQSQPQDKKIHWRQVLVVGELKANPSADTAENTHLDLARYAREVFASQDTRRYVLGFTLCGSLMRLWSFDRAGGIASASFDLLQDGHSFVSAMLGFHCMTDEQLGFDPTIQTNTTSGKRFLEIHLQTSDTTERIVLDDLILRTRSIRSRGTTCWKGHREGLPGKPLVVKDSWQVPERNNEGALLAEVAAAHIPYVARMYHYETVRVAGREDDVQFCVRGGLDVTKATNYGQRRSVHEEPSSARPTSGSSRSQSRGPSRLSRSRTPGTMDRSGAGSDSTTGEERAKRKRTSTEMSLSLPSPKRSLSVSPARNPVAKNVNRVHQRIILHDYGKPIYKASSPAALLVALEHCVQGHEKLYRADILHRDVSLYNLLVNEDADNPSWPAFLIDLDLAVRVSRIEPTGAEGRTGTKAFMAIGVLMGKPHTFRHDLESFFWVLFWICIHYDGPEKDARTVQQFENWNFANMRALATFKAGIVLSRVIFEETTSENITPYYKVILPVLHRLRKALFLDESEKQDDEGLYGKVRTILKEGALDLTGEDEE